MKIAYNKFFSSFQMQHLLGNSFLKLCGFVYAVTAKQNLSGRAKKKNDKLVEEVT